MKIQVALSIKTNGEADSPINLVVSPFDTVKSLKEKVVGVQLIPFPDQELYFDGKVMEDEAKLSKCGISEGSLLNLKVTATEAILAQQLAQLVEARDLSTDELGLLYCYKHGANIKQALKLLDFKGKLEDFVGAQKSLSMNNGSVAVVQEDTGMKPFVIADEVALIVKDCPSGSMEIRDLCQQFAQKFGTSLSSIAGLRPEDFLSKNPMFELYGASNQRKRVSLRGCRKKSPPSEVSTIDSPPRVESPELTIDAAPGLADAPPGLGAAGPPGLGPPPGLGKDDENVHMEPDVTALQYVELHDAIHSNAFSSETMRRVNDLVAFISESSFLDIHHVVTGGSVGKGTFISGDVSPEIVFFLEGLPVTNHETWMPALLKAVMASFASDLELLGLHSVHIVEDAIIMKSAGQISMTAKLSISPVFEGYAHTLQILRDQGPEAQFLQTLALAKERTQFVARQPNSVKKTIRLMKWWRNQQQWSSSMTCPCEEILELATIYSAVQTQPCDQKTAIANVMSLLSRFHSLRVVWSNYYSKDDVPAALLHERPLLLDPTNPFVNVADPQTFNASELMELASTTHFFW